MANPIKNRPVEPILQELASKGFDPLGPLAIAIRDLVTRADKTANNNGEIQAQANVSTRTEPLSTTLTNVEATGAFNSLANVADTSTDHLTDGTGSPLQGGKNGFQGLNTSGQLKGTFKNNQVNVTVSPTSSTVLSNDGVSTAIDVAAESFQYGDGLVSYNAGSVDPGTVGGPFFIFADDPDFAGGSVVFQFSTNSQDQAAANGRVPFGAIITASGSSKTGGGTSGGTTPGGGGGRGIIQG